MSSVREHVSAPAVSKMFPESFNTNALSAKLASIPALDTTSTVPIASSLPAIMSTASLTVPALMTTNGVSTSAAEGVAGVVESDMGGVGRMVGAGWCGVTDTVGDSVAELSRVNHSGGNGVIYTGVGM